MALKERGYKTRLQFNLGQGTKALGLISFLSVGCAWIAGLILIGLGRFDNCSDNMV